MYLIIVLLVLIIILFYKKSAFTIFQMHKYPSDYVIPGFEPAVSSWRKYNSYIYYDYNDCRNFLNKYYDSYHTYIFDSINIGAFKADFFRYCWLYIVGGVYADYDSELLGKLPIENDISLILVRDDPSSVKALYNGFIYSRDPGCPLFSVAIRMVIENVESYKKGTKFEHYHLTGPSVLYKAFVELEPYYIDIPLGLISTSLGKILILGWDEDIIGGVIKHRCSSCIIDDDHWSKKIGNIPLVS